MKSEKIIVITPVYNEEKTVKKVIAKILKYVDHLIIINDGSKDNSKKILDTWKNSLKSKKNCVDIIHFSKNQGASAALKAGFIFSDYLIKKKKFSNRDLFIEIDSDGQHDPRYIKKLHSIFKQKNVDIVLARRDFSNYPIYKRIGNLGFTIISNILTFINYKDVESNFRISRGYVIQKIAKYYTGYRYSGAFEFGLLSGPLRFKVDNNFKIKIPFYRHGANIKDAFHMLFVGLYSWIKTILRIQNKNNKQILNRIMTELK